MPDDDEPATGGQSASELRAGSMPGWPPGSFPGSGSGSLPDSVPGSLPPGGELRWRVNSGLVVLKIAGTVIFMLLALLFTGDPVGLSIGLAAALALGAFALRDVLAPVRLAADADGVTVVSGFAGQRHLSWAEIERIRVDERRRLGTRNQLLEIDTSHSLHLFSGYELGASCADVAAVLQSLRARALST
jgi:hypothetical protein